MVPPNKILIRSDSNELKFKDTLKPVGGKEVFYIYEYVVSESKLGNKLGLTEIKYSDYIIHSVKPSEDFKSTSMVENITDGGHQPFRYKSIVINFKFYIPEILTQ